MGITTSFVDLAEMHPELEWHEIIAAGVGVFEDSGRESPFEIHLELYDLPGVGSDKLLMQIDRAGVAAERVARVRRTFEAHRRVELAAIAIAGLALYHVGRHEILDVAMKGSGADYLVDEDRHLLEIAGRSRQGDFHAAWQGRFQRLVSRAAGGFYLCVVEMETPFGRLMFRP